MTTIGFIGLGNMGMPMAVNLRKAGHEIKAFDTSPAVLDQAAGHGMKPQTSVDNLIPQSRLHHRAKTFGGWRNRRLPTGAIEWTSPHGFRFLVDHNGTHQLPPRQTRIRKPGPRPGP